MAKFLKFLKRKKKEEAPVDGDEKEPQAGRFARFFGFLAGSFVAFVEFTALFFYALPFVNMVGLNAFYGDGSTYIVYFVLPFTALNVVGLYFGFRGIAWCGRQIFEGTMELSVGFQKKSAARAHAKRMRRETEEKKGDEEA